MFCVHKIQTFCSGCMQDDVGMHRLWYIFLGIQRGFELCNQRTIWSPVGGGVPGWFVFAQHTHLNSVKMCPKETMRKIDGKMNNLPIFLKTSNIQNKQFYQSTRNFTTSIPSLYTPYNPHLNLLVRFSSAPAQNTLISLWH